MRGESRRNLVTLWSLLGVAALWMDLCVRHALAVNIPLGVLLPLTGSGSLGGQRALTAMQLAVADIAATSTTARAINFELIVNDTRERTDFLAAVAATHDLLDAGVAGLVGLAYSDQGMYAAALASSQGVPVLSYQCQTSALANKHNFPTFMRTGTSTVEIGDALVQLLQRFGWRQFALLQGVDQYGQDMASYMGSVLPSSISMVVETSQINATYTLAKRALQEVQQSKLRILVLQAQIPAAGAVLRAARELGMLSDSHVWIGTAWCRSSVAISQGIDFGPGALCMGSRPPSSLAFSSFADRLIAAQPAVFANPNNPPGATEANAYDAIIAYSYAVAQLYFSSNLPKTSANLLAALRQVTFQGLSGPVSFLPNGDRAPPGSLALLNNDNGQWLVKAVAVSSGTPGSGQFNLSFSSAINWGNGNAAVPSDLSEGPALVCCGSILLAEYLDGSTLPIAWSVRTALLADVICLICCWTVIILCKLFCCSWLICLATVEQARFSRKHRSVGTTKLQTAISNNIASQFFWVLCAGLLLGIGGVWCALVLGLCGVSVADLGVQIAPLPAVLSLCICTVLITGGLFIMQLFSPHQRLRVVPAPATAALPVSSVTSLNNIRDWCAHLRWQRVAGAILVSVACRASDFWLLSSVRFRGELQLHVTAAVLQTVASSGVACLALLAAFDLRMSKLRPWCSLLLAASIVSGQLVMIPTATATFDVDSSMQSDNWTLDALGIAASAVSAALCILAMGFNVSKLKLSRDTLDRILHDTRVGFAALRDELIKVSAAYVDLSVRSQRVRCTIEMINFSRPLFREHSLALVLCGDPIVPADVHVKLNDKAASGESSLNGKTSDPSISKESEDSMSGTALRGGAKNEVKLMKLIDTIRDVLVNPVKEGVAADIKFEHLLLNAATVELVKDFFMEQAASNNAGGLGHLPAVTFVLDSRWFRNLNSPAARDRVAASICRAYFEENARFEIKEAPAQLRADLLQRVRDGRVPATLFDALASAMIIFLEKNFMPSFIQTPAFKKCAMILNHPAYQLASDATHLTPATLERQLVDVPHVRPQRRAFIPRKSVPQPDVSRGSQVISGLSRESMDSRLAAEVDARSAGAGDYKRGEAMIPASIPEVLSPVPASASGDGSTAWPVTLPPIAQLVSKLTPLPATVQISY